VACPEAVIPERQLGVELGHGPLVEVRTFTLDAEEFRCPDRLSKMKAANDGRLPRGSVGSMAEPM
jgi:hypothetical protein